MKENDAPAELGGSLCLIPSHHSRFHVNLDVGSCSFLAVSKSSVRIGNKDSVAS